MISSTSSSRNQRARRSLLALAAVFVALNAAWLVVWQVIPFTPVSESRYLAAVSDKIAMLRARKGERGRVVVVGGSGAAFSISAQDLGRDLGRPVFNGGIQASIGLRNLIDLYAPVLDPQRDLVVLVPELELLAQDERYTQSWCDVIYLRRALGDLARRPRCLPQIVDRSWQEMRFHLTGERVEDSVYRRSGFNVVGDLTSHLSIDQPAPDLSHYTLPDVTEQKLAQFEDYVRKKLIARGFAVLFVPAAMPASACARAPEKQQALIDRLSRLSTVDAPRYRLDDFCLPAAMFFDGAAHLGRSGRARQTANVRAALALSPVR